MRIFGARSSEIKNERFVIDPSPRDLDELGVTVDLALHNLFYRTAIPVADGVSVEIVLDADPYKFMEQFEADRYILKPGDFILGETVELLSVPPDICGWIEGKSGLATPGPSRRWSEHKEPRARESAPGLEHRSTGRGEQTRTADLTAPSRTR